MIPPFEILGKTFAIYPLLAMVGIFVAGGFACRQTSRRGLDENDMIVLLLVAAIGVLVGSHLLYALTHPSLTWQGVRTLFTQGFTQDTWTQSSMGGYWGDWQLGGSTSKSGACLRCSRTLPQWPFPCSTSLGEWAAFWGAAVTGLRALWDLCTPKTPSPWQTASGGSRFSCWRRRSAWGCSSGSISSCERAEQDCFPGTCSVTVWADFSWNFSGETTIGDFCGDFPPPSGSACCWWQG